MKYNVTVVTNVNLDISLVYCTMCVHKALAE